MQGEVGEFRVGEEKYEKFGYYLKALEILFLIMLLVKFFNKKKNKKK